MLQAYFMSILFNALTGYILVVGNNNTETEGWSFSLNNEKVRLGIGILAFTTGILKILSPVTENIPVVGDLFPALAGLAGGCILIMQYFPGKTAANTADFSDDFGDDTIPSRGIAGRISALVIKHKKIIGIFCLISALLHLVFYPVIFL